MISTQLLVIAAMALQQQIPGIPDQAWEINPWNPLAYGAVVIILGVWIFLERKENEKTKTAHEILTTKLQEIISEKEIEIKSLREDHGKKTEELFNQMLTITDESRKDTLQNFRDNAVRHEQLVEGSTSAMRSINEAFKTVRDSIKRIENEIDERRRNQ